MNVTPSDIVALVGALTGVGGLLAAWRTSRSSAKKNDVDALRGIIDEQGEYIAAQGKRIEVLEGQVKTWQRRFMRLCAKYSISPDSEITGPLKAVDNASE